MMYKFEQIAYNLTAKRLPTKADMETYIGLEHLESGSLDVREFGSKAEIKGEKLIMTKGDVLLGKRNAYLRRAAIAPHDGLFSAHGMILRPKEDVINKDYFPFFIASDIFFDEAVRISVGGLSPTINWKDLKVVEFDLPSLEEQKVLADKLWAAYKLKESYRQLLTTTDEMVKAKFQKMFGEATWEEKKISDIIASNFSGEWGEDDTDGTGTKVIKTNNFNNDGSIDFEEIITRNIPSERVERKRLQRGDILLERSGGTKDNPVGRVVYFDNDGIYVTNNFVQTLRCDSSVNSKYIFYNLYFYYNMNKVEIRRLGHQTSGIQNLDFHRFMDKTIAVPPIEEQERFAAIATQAEATKASLRQSIESIDRVIRSLINQ